MSELVTIAGTLRTTKGKGAARKLRAKGLIPGNILHKAQSTPIQLDPKWLSKAWQSGKKFTLQLENETKQVVIHELQIHPVKRTALHVDLMVG